MIYTCTFNPAIDYRVEVNRFVEGELNRAAFAKFSVGGKGINVSIVLSNLDVKSVTTGFIGGFTGNYIEDYSRNTLGLESKFIHVDNLTRVNVKLKNNRLESEINAKGPSVSELEYQALLDVIREMKKGDLLAIGGSPAMGSASSYEQICKLCFDKGIEFVLDTNKENLRSCLTYNPLLVKPNLFELEELFNVKISSHKEMVFYCKELLDKGAKNVILSLGKDGSLFVNNDVIYMANPIKGDVKNTVGAGDSMVAGFITGFTQHKDYLEAYKLAVACGTATAFSYDLGTKDEIEEYYKVVKISEVEL